MIKCIVFDAYGTLISTGSGSVDAARRILELNGCKMDAALFYKKWKELHRKHIENLTDFVKEEKIFEKDLEELYRIYGINGNYRKDVIIMLNTLGKRTAFAETKRIIEKVSTYYAVCIGSTTDTKPLLRDLKRNEISVENVFTSESLRVYKPQKDFYVSIAEQMQFDYSEILFVGDSLTDDVQGPGSTGMKTCFVNRKGIRWDKSRFNPDYVIGDLNELPQLLDRI